MIFRDREGDVSTISGTFLSNDKLSRISMYSERNTIFFLPRKITVWITGVVFFYSSSFYFARYRLDMMLRNIDKIIWF